MARPGVIINLGNGALGRVATTDDGVAGLICTGTAVEGKMELNKAYTFGSTKDLENHGITEENNPTLHKDIAAFYAQSGEGSELYVLVVAEATTLTQMCESVDGSPLSNLIDAGTGRIRIVAINKKAPVGYEPDLAQGVDSDVITAAEKAHATANSYASQMKPFRVLLAAPALDPTVAELYQPAASSYNRVALVCASDDKVGKTAAMGLVLGRASKIQPPQSLGRVKDGAIATELYLTNGELHKDKFTDILYDAGYIAPIHYPNTNGVYLNGDAMAAPVKDDYSVLSNGRVIDKAMVIAYSTYITEVMDNIQIQADGKLNPGTCLSFAGMLENAIAGAMQTQISEVSVNIDHKQNVLSTGTLNIQCKITPLATMRTIVVDLGFHNPALNTK